MNDLGAIERTRIGSSINLLEDQNTEVIYGLVMKFIM